MRTIITLQIWRNQKAQDMVEYALLTGALAVAAGAFVPSVATIIINMLTVLQRVVVDSANLMGNNG